MSQKLIKKLNLGNTTQKNPINSTLKIIFPLKSDKTTIFDFLECSKKKEEKLSRTEI